MTDVVHVLFDLIIKHGAWKKNQLNSLLENMVLDMSQRFAAENKKYVTFVMEGNQD